MRFLAEYPGWSHGNGRELSEPSRSGFGRRRAFSGASRWATTLIRIRASGPTGFLGNYENSLDVGRSEDAPFAVAAHARVPAGYDEPTEGAGIDALEGPEVPGPKSVLVRFQTCNT